MLSARPWISYVSDVRARSRFFILSLCCPSYTFHYSVVITYSMNPSFIPPFLQFSPSRFPPFDEPTRLRRGRKAERPPFDEPTRLRRGRKAERPPFDELTRLRRGRKDWLTDGFTDWLTDLLADPLYKRSVGLRPTPKTRATASVFARL